jgi:tetratricopeptide (TPR) repeat protein
VINSAGLRPDSAEVGAALGRILSSGPFVRSPQLAAFLRFVVSETLSDRDVSLKEYALGVQVFNRGADFDPRIDPIVRVQARQLRFKLREYYEADGRAEQIRIEVPKGSYLPEISFADGELGNGEPGSPPADLVPAARASRNVEKHRGRRRLVIASLLLAAMAVGVVSLWIGGRRGQHSADRAVNPVAQDLYLRGKYYWNQRTPESLNLAVGFFNQAIARDPRYAGAYAGLADCYNLLREYSAMPASQAWPRAIAAARKAVELDGSSADAHTSLAFALFYGALDTAGGEREYRRAIELNPDSANAHHWYATSLAVQGRYRESLAEIERARELDPSSTSILADKGFILFDAGEVNQSIALLKQVEAADPASQSTHTYLALIDLTKSNFVDYLAEQRKVAELSRNASALAISAAALKGFAAGGSGPMLASILETQKDLLKEGRCSHYDVARTYAFMGKRQEALDQLQTAVANREMDIVALGNDPSLASLRGEPRFRDLQKELRRVLRS